MSINAFKKKVGPHHTILLNTNVTILPVSCPNCPTLANIYLYKVTALNPTIGMRVIGELQKTLKTAIFGSDLRSLTNDIYLVDITLNRYK